MFGSPQIQIPQWLKKMLMTQPDIIKKKGVGEENASYMKLWQWTKQNKWSSGKDANCENWKIEIAYIICQRHIQNHIKNIDFNTRILNSFSKALSSGVNLIGWAISITSWTGNARNVFIVPLIIPYQSFSSFLEFLNCLDF